MEREADVLRRAVSLLQDRLPPGWNITASYDVRASTRRRIDAVIELSGSDQSPVKWVVECKRTLAIKDLPAVLNQLKNYSDSMHGHALPMVVARYLSESARNWLDSEGVSYMDATGNLRVLSGSPALYVRDRGADRDPWRGPGRPRGTLRGDPAARVVRALADYPAPLPVRKLVDLSGASTGATYRVLEFLEQEALVTRGARGVIETVDWRRMIERWSADYGFVRDNTPSRYLQPRGLPTLLEALRAAPQLRYAVTGSLAAQQWAPYAPARSAALYVEDIQDAVKTLGLREVDSGANVLLAVPRYDVAFDRTSLIKDITFAATSHVAVDLLTGPGRAPAEGEVLLNWMETHVSDWRAKPATRPNA